MAPDEVAPLRYGPAVSPHLAAELAGETIDAGGCSPPARRGASAGATATLIVEGVGGLLVPLADDLHRRATSPSRSGCRC